MAPPMIEHVTLFKLNDTTSPSDAESFAQGLNSLASIPQVLAIAAGPIRSSSADFTHFLHSRYASEDDLAAYAAHPDHLALITTSSYLVADVLSVDWLVSGEPRGALRSGSAARVWLLRLKEGLGERVKREVMEEIGRFGDGLEDFSFGENLSPARAKGFSVGFMAVFPSVGDLDSVDWDSSEVRAKEYLNSSIVVDFLVPSSHESVSD